MRREERILRALGNVKDSFVLEASQYMDNPQKGMLVQPKKKSLRGFSAAAAVLLVAVGSAAWYLPRHLAARQSEQTIPEPTLSIHVQTGQEWKMGDWPAFRIEYDHSKLELVEGVGGAFLYPIEYSDSLPVSELKIEFLPGLLPWAAMEKSRAEMGVERTSIHQDQQTGRYAFRIDQGTDWNSVVKEVTILGAGRYGSFRLTSQYFLEATEGWGSTFGEIVASFTCPLSESVNPEAEQAIMDFAEGYFSGSQITMLANYYGNSQNLRDVYTQEASRVKIISLQGLDTLDEQIEQNGFGAVSLAFLETGEADSYTYLSMEVMKTQAGYRVCSYGLEK